MATIAELRARNNRVRRGMNHSGRPIQDWNSISGQRIGEILQAVMDISFRNFAEEYSSMPDNPQLSSLGGGQMRLVTGSNKQIDGRIQNDSTNRITLIGESKWLKDQKHQNDKGGWILAIPSTLIPRYPSVSGMFCLLAGPWANTSAHNSINANPFFRSVLISYQAIVDFLNRELLVGYQVDEDGNIIDPRELMMRWCDAEDPFLANDEDPYVAWACRLLELEIDSSSVNERIQSSLRELIEATLEFEINEFALTVRTQRGEFQYQIDDVDEASAILELWRENPRQAYENYVSLFD